MLLSFAGEFADMVSDGRKRQTIRAHGKRGGPKVGETLHCYSGSYSKKRRLLGRFECVSVEPFEIVITDQGGVYWVLGEAAQTNDECAAIAVADGFVNQFAMVDYFKSNGGLPFEGLLIKWDYPGEHEK